MWVYSNPKSYLCVLEAKLATRRLLKNIYRDEIVWMSTIFIAISYSRTHFAYFVSIHLSNFMFILFAELNCKPQLDRRAWLSISITSVYLAVKRKSWRTPFHLRTKLTPLLRACDISLPIALTACIIEFPTTSSPANPTRASPVTVRCTILMLKVYSIYRDHQRTTSTTTST